MKTIRNATFETNSSSTHALVILSKQEYKDFCNDKIALNLHNGNTVPLNKNIIANEDGTYTYEGENYDSLYELMCDEIIDDEYATQDYLDHYAEVVEKEVGDKVAMSIYRGDVW